eukprot:3673530-Amphidinium_carterae.1
MSYDPKHKRHYYYNHSTLERTWRRPVVEEDCDCVAEGAGNNKMEGAEDRVHGRYRVSDHKNSRQSNNAQQPSEIQPQRNRNDNQCHSKQKKN